MAAELSKSNMLRIDAQKLVLTEQIDNVVGLARMGRSGQSLNTKSALRSARFFTSSLLSGSQVLCFVWHSHEMSHTSSFGFPAHSREDHQFMSNRAIHFLCMPGARVSRCVHKVRHRLVGTNQPC